MKRQVSRLQRENYELRKKLETIFPDNNYGPAESEELRKIERRLMELEEENERLSRENTILKTEQGSLGGMYQLPNLSLEEMLDVRYRFDTLDNDLQKINSRFEDGLSSYYPKNSYYDR